MPRAYLPAFCTHPDERRISYTYSVGKRKKHLIKCIFISKMATW